MDNIEQLNTNTDMKSEYEFFRAKEFTALFNFCFYPKDNPLFYSGHAWRSFTSEDADHEFYDAMSVLCDIIDQYKELKGISGISNVHYLQVGEDFYKVQRTCTAIGPTIEIFLHFFDKNTAIPEVSMQDLSGFSLSELSKLQDSDFGRH